MLIRLTTPARPRTFQKVILPDELNEDNFAKSEPKPAEPKNEGTRQEQCVPQKTS